MICGILQISSMNTSASTVSCKSKIKIVLLGDQSVGKSCIIDRYVNDKFDQTSNPTVGIDFLAKNITHKNKNYRLQIWDTAGQERFKSLIPGYIRDAHCALIVFDVTSKTSLNNVEGWLQLYQDNMTGHGFTLLVGNKIDLKKEREVDKDEGMRKAKELGMLYYEVSAKQDENLEKLFEDIVETYVGMTLDGIFKTSKRNNHVVHQVPETEHQEEKKNQNHTMPSKDMKSSRIKLKKEGNVKKQEGCC